MDVSLEMMPVYGTKPKVGLSPTSPQWDEGYNGSFSNGRLSYVSPYDTDGSALVSSDSHVSFSENEKDRASRC